MDKEELKDIFLGDLHIPKSVDEIDYANHPLPCWIWDLVEEKLGKKAEDLTKEELNREVRKIVKKGKEYN